MVPHSSPAHVFGALADKRDGKFRPQNTATKLIFPGTIEKDKCKPVQFDEDDETVLVIHMQDEDGIMDGKSQNSGPIPVTEIPCELRVQKV